MRRAAQIALLVAVAGARARAQETLDEIDKGAATAPVEGEAEKVKAPIATVNGYVDNRLQYAYVDPNVTFAPTNDVPSVSDILEANVQLKVNLGRNGFAYGDLSLLFIGGWLFYQRDGMGGRASVDDHDVSTLRPFIALNELYASWTPRPWLNLLAGKKRIVWGSGFAFNPTDLVNPAKDPTDPNFQRSGAWLARMELPFEKLTLTALAAPAVLYQQNGLPYQFLRYPGYLPSGESFRDDQYHYLLAGRLYALVANADLNLMYFFSNQYRDGFNNKSRFGISFSRYFLTDYELHVEALLQTGSGRVFPNHFCVTAPFSPGCPDPLHMAFTTSRVESDAFYPRVLVGARTMFRDESSLSIEYYYQADGYDDLAFEDFVRGLVRLQQQFPGAGAQLLGGGGSGASPNRFTFDPLRRHYLIASYSKPRIHDDWTATLVLILGLRDLSGMVSPSVSWNTTEWLTLSLSAFVPIRGIPVGQVDGGDGHQYSEYSLLPFDFRVLFEARAFY